MAEVDGEIAGFVIVVGDEVEQVYVAAGHRGSGGAAVLALPSAWVTREVLNGSSLESPRSEGFVASESCWRLVAGGATLLASAQQRGAHAMTELEFTYATDPHRFGDAVRESLTEHPLHVHPPGPIETVRTASYRGHEITVRTTYLIEIDGRPIGGHLFVTNSGDVQIHALPNYTFPSAVDMVRQLIDAFPEGFAAVDPPGEQAHDQDQDQDHEHGHGHGHHEQER